MPRAFRFEPPRPRADLVTRPRLLEVLLGRWRHRVVTVVGGAGLGKTTLLGQAVAENLLAPQGDDVWVGLEAADSGRDNVARAVAAAVGAAGIEPTYVADAVWRRSPTEVCIVLDDVHVLAVGSGGAGWLQELVEALPANGHVVLASRAEPALRLARLRAQGEVVAVGEDDLRFSDAELARFAERRRVEPERFTQTGGWPAMVELAASVERPAAGEFVWEEVLDPLGPERRRILATVCDLGGADDELASAALGTKVDLGQALDGVPLVATGIDGWRIPHPLWRSVAGIELPSDERNELRHRAVEALVERCRFDEAFALLAEVELWSQASDVLRAACVASARPTAEQLDRWLSSCPPEVHDSAGGRLAVAFLTTLRNPTDAGEPLAGAAAAARDAGDPEGELAALAELARVAWWARDLGALAPVAGRVAELAKAGHPLAQGLAAFGRAIAADVAGDEAAALAALDRIPAGVLDPGWEASTRWLRAQLLLARGLPADALEVLDAADPGPDPALQAVFTAVRSAALWGLGRVDEVIAGVADLPDGDWGAGVSHNQRLGLLGGCTLFACVGDVEAARRCLDALGPDRLATASAESVAGAVAAASMLLADGEEDRAAGVIADAVERHGRGQELERRLWRGGLGMSYVFVPEARARWDAADLGPYHEMARGLAAGVVAARTGMGDLRTLDLPAPALVRSALHFRFAAELAVGLTAVDRPEGEAILEAFGVPGREAVRRIAGSKAAAARPAKALLAASPAPPAEPTYLAVLGPLVLFAKLMAVAFLMFWVRFTYPRLREDQLQAVAWKYLIPIGLANILVTGIFKVAF